MVFIFVLVVWNVIFGCGVLGEGVFCESGMIIIVIGFLLELLCLRFVCYENFFDDLNDLIFFFFMEDIDIFFECYVFLGNYR